MSEEAIAYTTTPAPEKPQLVAVLLTKRYGSLFPGERAGFEPAIASALIANGGAVAIGSDNEPIFPAESTEDSPSELTPADDGIDAIDVAEPAVAPPADKPQSESEAIKPFVADGIDRDVARVLVQAGLDTVEKVTQAIAAGRDLTELRGIGPKSFESLKALYGE